MVREISASSLITSSRGRCARVAAAILATALLSGCGVKGPLKLPTPTPATATTGTPAAAAGAGAADNARQP
jgi:predicted small lipoprotein YifL